VIQKVIDALSDDLNTHLALAELRRCERKDDVAATLIFLGLLPNAYFDGAREDSERQRRGIQQALDHATTSIEAEEREAFLRDRGTSEENINALVASRTVARSRKDFKESDRIRDELAAMGVVIKDSKEGTTWEIAR